MRQAENRGLGLALAGMALLLGATFVAYRGPAPSAENAPPAEFSALRAQALLRELVGDGVPHPIGSAGLATVRTRILARLTSLGLAPELQSGLVCNERGVCGSPVNIIAELGRGSSDTDAVLLAAHYDSVPAGPGASDDGAGVAAALEIARILKGLPAPRHSIFLLLTDGEEAGLLGAKLFTREHPLSSRVKAAVNLEARGTSGPSFMFETGSANSWLMHLYGASVARPISNSLFYFVYRQLPNDTDFTVFKAAGYQGFNFAFIGDVGHYHTPLDSFANVNLRSIQHQGDNAQATVWALANADNLHPPIAESAFSDVFAHTLTAWPASLCLPAALAALTLLLAEAVMLLRLGLLNGRQILWGGIGTVSHIALGSVLAIGLFGLMHVAGFAPLRPDDSWIAHPLPMSAGCAAIAFLSAGIAATFARRAGFWGFWLAANLLVALLCVVVSALIPSTSVALLLPAVAAGLAALPCMRNSASSRAPEWADLAALLPALVFFGATLPLLRFLYAALGSLAWPVSTIVLCLATSCLLPLIAAAAAAARLGWIGVAALTVVSAPLITLCLPAHSQDLPERINIEYWLDADAGRAHWLVRPASNRLPAALAAAANFDPVPRARFAGSSSKGFVAAAPLVSLAAPELNLTAPASRTTSSMTHYDLRLRSLRGAPEALVVFPAGARIVDMSLGTAQGPLRSKLLQLKSGATLLDVVGLPEAGLDFSIDAPAYEAIAVQVFDQSYDLVPGALLQRARGQNAASSQNGDITVVQHTVSLAPAAGRQ